MRDEVKIPVSLPGAAQASADAGRVAQGLDKINKATGDQAKQSQSAAKGINELGEATEKGAAVGRIFGEVMRGNFFALAQLGPLLKATGAAVKTSIFGVALIGATALLHALPPLIARLKGTKEGADQVADSAKAMSEAFEKAAKERGSALSKELAAITEEATGAAEALDRVLRLQKQIADAKGGETPEQRRAREDMELGHRFSAAQSTRDKTSATATGMAADFEEIDAGIQRDQAAREERKAMQRELDALKQLPSRLGGTRRAERIRGRLASTDYLETPESLAFTSEQQKRREQLRPLVERANAAAAKADADFQSISRNVVGLRADGSAIPDPSVMIARGLEDRKRREAAGIPEPASRGGSFSQVIESGATSVSVRAANGDQIGQRIAAAVEQRVREGEEAIARAVERRMAEIQSQLKSQRTK